MAAQVRVFVEEINDYFPLFMTASKAANVIGVHSVTVRRMLDRGELRGTKNNGQWKVDSLSLFEFLDMTATRVMKEETNA